MAEMPVVPNISRLSKNVLRILGQNAGKFTLQGTNTYLVGQTSPYILVDTAEGREEYIPLLEESLKSPGPVIKANQPDVSDIILTHKHHDHINGLPSVLSLLQKLWDERNPGVPFVGPRIHKFPLMTAEVEKVLNSLPNGSFTPSRSGAVLHDLQEGQTFPVTQSSPGDPSLLEVIHTPGHTLDSLCLYLAADSALFTADTVLGYGSSVFEDLWTYMTSLRKMIEFKTVVGGEQRYTTVYPGHGPTASHEQVDMYLRHRVARENEVLHQISSEPPSEEHWTTWTIMKNIYAKYPEELWEPAAHSVDLHLQKLVTDGKVQKLDGEGRDTKWRFVQ
ncbi:lactamase [Cytidiella melzeri]|nr:lactamase [Cytidiella melzeri]